MRRVALRKRDAGRILSELRALGMEVDCDLLERLESGKYTILLCDGFPMALEAGERIVPTLMAVAKFRPPLPRVLVDEGAVPYVMNGARVMGPGIAEVKGEVSEGDVVLVCGPDGKIIAVGISRRDKYGLLSKEKGVAVANVHHVGDRVWRDFSHFLVRARGGH